jgi:hypothetical protein
MLLVCNGNTGLVQVLYGCVFAGDMRIWENEKLCSLFDFE